MRYCQPHINTQSVTIQNNEDVQRTVYVYASTVVMNGLLTAPQQMAAYNLNPGQSVDVNTTGYDYFDVRIQYASQHCRQRYLNDPNVGTFRIFTGDIATAECKYGLFL